MPESATVSALLGKQSLIIESGKVARLADGAVTVRTGDTIVLVTAVSAPALKENACFLPLTVEYRERAAAVGKFPSGYLRREGRPSEKEILTCRMTDRPLRPLFPRGYFYDTQIISTLLSGDGENDPDILSINGASAALMVSDIPFAGPMGAVRIGRAAGQWLVNPTHTERLASDVDLVYVGTREHALMIEGTARELPEIDFKEALALAQSRIQTVLLLQQELASRVGRPKREMELRSARPDLLEVAYEVAQDRIEAAIYQQGKVARAKAVTALREEVKGKILERFPEASEYEVSAAFEHLEKKAFRRSILDLRKRCDGRRPREVRPLSGECGLLPGSHGSALFGRGETQTVCLATLAPADEAQSLDAYAGGEQSKRFMLHYNFPPFSVGETGRTGGLNRREIGHGALAERSLEPVLPPASEFPYAIRVTSEVLESNGSTSMATVCGASLALMDAGIPLTAAVAGVSVGLVTEFDDDGRLVRYLTLTDIIGSEDHYGDMDFKLSGTQAGITGFQLDLKLPGISLALLAEAVDQARDGRLEILRFMDGVLARPRREISPNAPRIETIQVPTDKIG
ncbi:MAG: polyribonucleotide nucleotidyltransferase, partial [Candidatus Riflebacteria bacterium]|nr:polyribonucleotide nucleotidyltransferase [Candidatus Riflebacteria bacterium]